jgi:hypothetical protein
MTLWRWLIRKWWLVYGLGAAMIMLVALILIALPPSPQITDAEVNYVSILFSTFLELTLYLPPTLLLFGILLYAAAKKRWWRLVLLILATMAALVFWLTNVGALSGSKLVGPRMVHADSQSIKGRWYNLAAYHDINFPGTVAGYILFECESIMSCVRLGQQPKYWLSSKPPSSQLAWQGNELQVIVDGELLFSYRPGDS